MNKTATGLARATSLLCVLAAFGSCGDSSTTPTTVDTSSVDVETSSGDTDAPGLDPSYFLQAGLAAPITTEDCTLSGGTATTCYRIEIAGTPAGSEIGPFCPPTISSSANEGGIWFDGGGEVYDIDGDFIVNLASLYGDSNWLLYDPATGNVNVTDTQVACEAAARPNVDPQFQNHCVECSLDYYGGGTRQTFLIPTTPVSLSSPSGIRGDVGVSLNGTSLAAPAPVAAILGAYTIAAFDDCGGHINPNAGYHYHAATGCTEIITQNDGHAAVLGYAMDGYAIHGMLNGNGMEPGDLDVCRGHTDATRGYHYHAASAGENMFIGCFRGEQGGAF